MRICNTELDIVFRKEIDKHRDGTRKVNTICVIRAGEDVVGEGRANLNYRDQYNKITGKKVALRRAMESCELIFGNKEKRILVWDWFKEYMRIDERRTQKSTRRV